MNFSFVQNNSIDWLTQSYQFLKILLFGQAICKKIENTILHIYAIHMYASVGVN